MAATAGAAIAAAEEDLEHLEIDDVAGSKSAAKNAKRRAKLKAKAKVEGLSIYTFFQAQSHVDLTWSPSIGRHVVSRHVFYLLNFLTII